MAVPGNSFKYKTVAHMDLNEAKEWLGHVTRSPLFFFSVNVDTKRIVNEVRT